MISYAPFWETLKRTGTSTYSLINNHHISGETFDRMRKRKGISTLTVAELCRILKCRVEDIIEYVEENK